MDNSKVVTKEQLIERIKLLPLEGLLLMQAELVRLRLADGAANKKLNSPLNICSCC
jgi:hypothetical protein